MIDAHLGVLALETDEAENDLVEIIREVFNGTDIGNKSWSIKQSSDPFKQWIQFHDTSASLPLQGWKLHISATRLSASSVLRAVLPILLAKSAAFKTTASLERLKMLNRGGAGNSQIGKFITIYPRNDDEAVELATLLDKATDGLEGLSIPSDHALRPGSLVYYRYGGFSSQLFIQNNIGLIIPAINAPEHEIEPDYRHVPYQAPAWATDPFIRAGIVVEQPPPQRLIGNRYLIVAIMATSINSTVYLGSDLEAVRTCAIKGPGFTHYNNYDSASRSKVLHESHILHQILPNAAVPQPLDVVEQNGNHYLVMEDIEGVTLDAYIGKLIARGRHVPMEQVLIWSKQLAHLLHMFHTKGLVYTDLKPSNVIIDADKHLRLIDFELAHENGDPHPKWRGCGTPGYMSPQQQDGQPATQADDIYGFGALLYSLVTGAEPSYAPKGRRLLDRPVALLTPGISEELKSIIERCLEHEPSARYSSMVELQEHLTRVNDHLSISTIPFGSESLWQHPDEAKKRYRDMARRLLQTLCAVARPPAHEEGLAWESVHPISYGLMSRDINTGNSGTILALAELFEEFDDAHGRSVLDASTHWLASSVSKNTQPLPGLYVGEAGVGAALLRAGQVMQQSNLIEQAAAKSRLIAALPFGSPDLFNGTAGRLRFHHLMWDETQEKEHLQFALQCTEHLVATTITKLDDTMSWSIPEDYGSLSGQEYLGYAHGIAGIADTLLDTFEITSDERLLPVIQRVARRLGQLAMPVLNDNSGLNWSRIEGELPTAAFWCHGAAGIGRFFLHIAQLGIISEAMEIAVRAAHMVARGTRGAGPTQCHGLAGNIEFLLDMYQATGDSSYLSEAYSMAFLLEAFSREKDGNLVFSSENPDIFTPDYMVGYAGVALSLLRLSEPERIPHQLSRAGFRYRRKKVS